MKITYLIDCEPEKNQEEQLFHLLKEVTNYHDIQLICFGETVYYRKIFDLPLKLIFLSRNSRNTIKAIKNVSALLNEFQPDIIHTRDYRSHITILPYIIKNNVKVINNAIIDEHMIPRPLKTRIFQKIARISSHKIVANSYHELQLGRLEESDKALVIHKGVDIQHEYSKNSLNQKIQKLLNSFQHNVVMMGSALNSEDFLSLSKVAKNILQARDDIGFFIIGYNSRMEKAKNMAGSLINKNIFFLQYNSSLKDLLPYFDIGIMLNNIHINSNKIAHIIKEYMAAGLPVVATKTGVIPELIEDYKNGVLVKPFSEKQIIESLNLLFNSHKKRKKMADNASNRINDKFKINTMINKYIDLYESLITSPSQPTQARPI